MFYRLFLIFVNKEVFAVQGLFYYLELVFFITNADRKNRPLFLCTTFVPKEINMAEKTITKEEKIRRILKAKVNYYLSIEGYTMTDLAKKLYMSRSALYAKLADNNRFTLTEIRKLCNIIKLEDEKRLMLLS